MPLHRGRHRLRHGLLPPGSAQRSVRQETGADVLGVSQPERNIRRRRPALQQPPHLEAPHPQRRLRRRPRQHRAEPNRRRPIAHSEPHVRADKRAGVDGDGGVHDDAPVPRVHEQRPRGFGRQLDPHTPVPLLDDGVHAADAGGEPGGARRAKDHGARRHAPAVTDQEHHGILALQEQGFQPEQVHLHPEHHPGRRGPHAGAQVLTAHPRAQARQLHRVGPRVHSSRVVTQVALRADRAPRLRADARQPHQHQAPVHQVPHPVRQAHASQGFLGPVRAAPDVRRRAG